MGKGGKRVSRTGKQSNLWGDFPYWTAEEDGIILKHRNAPEIHKLLPHRTLGAIYARRNKLGVKFRERDTDNHSAG